MKKLFLTILVINQITIVYGQVNSTNSSSITSGVSSIEAGKISTINQQWQQGGIFYGLKPEQEILGLRTENSKKFDIGNGKKQVIIGGPFHYMDDKNLWQDIDLTIGKNGNGIFPFYNNTNAFETEFGKDHLTGVRMKYKSNEMKFGLNTAISCNNWIPAISESKVINQENILIYKEIYKGIDLEYELNDKAVLHRLKFNNKESLLNVTYESKYLTISENIEIPIGSLLFDSIGLISENRKTFGNIFISLNGDTIFTIIASKIWDASFDELNEKINDNIIIVNSFVEFTSKSSFQLMAKIPIDWLTSENRKFPVTFDPTVQISSFVGYIYDHPWGVGYMQRMDQTIYKGSDIYYTGSITNIGFYITKLNSISNTNSTIRMQIPSISTFSSASFVTSGSWTTCYNGTLNYSSGSSYTFRDITLSTPFNFSSSSNNLLIETRFKNSSASSGGGSWAYSTASNNPHCWASENSSSFPSSGNTYYGPNFPTTRITISSSSSCAGWYTYPTNEPYTSSGKAGNSFTVYYNGTSCSFSAYSNDNWIKNIKYSASTKIVSYDIDNNPNYSTRDGYIYVKDGNNNLVSTFTVYQDALSCSLPTMPTNFTATAVSKSQIDLNWIDNANNETSYKVERLSGSWITIATLPPNSENYKDQGLSPSTTYYFRISACCNTKCTGVSAISETTKDPGPIITITSEMVPPWQREGDDLMGSITANYAYINSGKTIQLDIYVNGNYAGTKSSKTTTGSSGTLIFDFDFKMTSLTPSPAQGDKIGYQLIENTSAVSADVSTKTNIIEKRWAYKNYYYNNNDKSELKIPIKYDPINKVTKAIIFREGNVSFKLKNRSLIKVESILYKENGLGYSEIPINITDGYLKLDNSNSTVNDVFPGDFRIEIFSGTTWLETMYFDLTKYGAVFEGDEMKNKIMVMIGGIYNETESSIDNLRKEKESYKEYSNNSYSIISYLRKELENEGYGVWYIAQGNANSIERNAFDIGRTLYEILLINPNISEITLVCHSKGGLDSRGFLQDYTLSFDGNYRFGVSDFKDKDKLKKIIFLGTPHRGGRGVIVGYGEFKTMLKPCPGILDLDPLSYKLNFLNTSKIYAGIKILNLTGFLNTDDIFIGDEVVPLSSSEYPPIGGIQLYQNSDKSDLELHMRLHKNSTLSKQGKCVENDNNLVKITKFIKGDNVQSCSHKMTWKGRVFFTASILPNARLEIKSHLENNYRLIGFTDENGILDIELFDPPNIRDSLRISAEGIETVSFKIDSLFIKSGMLSMALFHSAASSQKIKYPSIKINNNQTPIVNNNSISIIVNSSNAIAFEINYPFNQDSNYIPLNLNKNIATIKLDSGINDVVIRFIGLQDTIKLLKTFYYLTDSALKYFTRPIEINTKSEYIGVKFYLDNKFYCDIKNVQTKLPLFNWNNSCRFSLLGYRDTIPTIDSTGTINLSMSPISYSSNTDSVKYDYKSSPNLNYWKNITTKKLNINANSSVSIKQFDDSFSEKALIPFTRSFQFRNISLSGSPKLKTAICLDQSLIFSKSDAYMLDLLGDTLFTKFPLEENGVADYDSAVQKFSFDSLNFGHGNAKKETLVLVRKQAPVAIKKSFSIQVNDSSLIPFSSLFADPDSVKNDMTFEILNPGQKNFTYHLTNNGLFVKPDKCYTGKLSIQIKATHDWLNTIQSYDIEVPEVLPNISVSGSANFCNGDSLKFTAYKSQNHIYRWYRNNSLVLDELKYELVVHVEGKYHLTLTSRQTGCTYSSDTINIITTGTERWKDHCLRIFPNPSSGWVTVQMEGISYPSNLTIEVFDVWGRLIKIYNRKIEPTYIINEQYDLNELENGIYLFRTTLNNEQAITRKLNISR